MTTPAVQLDRVSFSYPPRALRDEPVHALSDVTMTVDAGSRLGVLGPNGGGKSTLVKLVLGLLEPDSGSITVLGTSPAEARRRGLVGYLPQRLTAELDFPLSVRQAVAMPLSLRASPFALRDRAAEHAADEALALVAMSHLADRPVGSLSGGQLQRAMIARAIAPRPRLLVLDEPTVGVDAAGQHRFADLINKLHAELGITIVTVSHDLRAIAAGSDRVACLHRSVHFHDAPSGLTPAILAEVFAHDVEAVFGHLHIDAHPAADCDNPAHTQSTQSPGEGTGPCCDHHHHDHTHERKHGEDHK